MKKGETVGKVLSRTVPEAARSQLLGPAIAAPWTGPSGGQGRW